MNPRRRGAPTGLRVLVVGAGLGGLATALVLRRGGHRVRILEQSSVLEEIGAGIQVVPNAARALAGLGVLDQMAARAVEPTATTRRRWQDGRLLGRYPLRGWVRERFGGPYLDAHRADIQTCLLDAATSTAGDGSPVEVVLGEYAEDVDPEIASVTTRAGRTFESDVVIAADGVRSAVRANVFGPDRPRYSGDDAYRSLIPADVVTRTARLRGLVDEPEATIWLGPGRHVIHYWIRPELLNLVAIVPGTGDLLESWSAPGSKSDLLEEFSGWHDTLRELLMAAPALLRLPMLDRDPIPAWSRGRVALLGDSCHAMLPYQSQGAAQALEDAIALGSALATATRADVPDALRQYGRARLPRASAVVQASRDNQRLFHLEEGPDQRQRDHGLARSAGDFDAYPWVWAGLEAAAPPAVVLAH